MPKKEDCQLSLHVYKSVKNIELRKPTKMPQKQIPVQYGGSALKIRVDTFCCIQIFVIFCGQKVQTAECKLAIQYVYWSIVTRVEQQKCWFGTTRKCRQFHDRGSGFHTFPCSFSQGLTSVCNSNCPQWQGVHKARIDFIVKLIYILSWTFFVALTNIRYLSVWGAYVKLLD